MNSETVINFDGLDFLDKLEKKINEEGLKGIVNLVNVEFPIGSLIILNQKLDSEKEPVYTIERVTISQINQHKVIHSNGDLNSISIIRSFRLPYVDTPFQIDIYGTQRNL